MADPIDLDHIERLLAEATPGPFVRLTGVVVTMNHVGVADCGFMSHGLAQSHKNADMFAGVVTAAPAMVAEIRRLRAEATQLVPRATEEALQSVKDQITEIIDRERARAREEGRAEERAAIVAWLLDEGEAFLSEDIERGKHREEDDNA